MTPQLGLRMRRTNDLAQTLMVLAEKVTGKNKMDKDDPLSIDISVRLEWIENELNNQDTKSNVFDVAEYGCDGWTRWANNLRDLCDKMISVDGYHERRRYLDAGAIIAPVNAAIATFAELQRILVEEVEVVK